MYFLANSISLFLLAFKAAFLYSFILSVRKCDVCSALVEGLLLKA